MSKIIEDYYKQVAITPVLLRQKLVKLQRNTDIMKEFEYWIKNGQYLKEDFLSVEGYTASSLAALSPFLDGEGAFMLLIDLREHPEQAKAKISRGFVIK